MTVAITWDDPVYGEERSVRARRADAVRKLQAAELSFRRWQLLVVVGWLLTVGCAVWALLYLGLLGIVAAVVWVYGALLSTFQTLPAACELAETRRRGLRHVQDEYDRVFAEMLERERGLQ